MQVSRLTHDLESWYERSHEERVGLMFSPHHATDDVGEIGENLASDSGIEAHHAANLAADVEDHGMVGHGQKVAAARDEDFEPTILRRDFDDNEQPGLHFDSWQRGIGDFVAVRQAMDAPHLDVDDHHDGIREFIEVASRGTYLMPPRSLRSLPPPRP
jgi:hypothetical protein